jgi:undecaprenyl-diphosphatase
MGQAADRLELTPLVGGMLLVVLLLGFAGVANIALGGSSQTFDERVLLSLRKADDRAVPIGPPIVRAAALDITALGSLTVLVLVVGGAAGFLAFQGLGRTAIFVVLASASGWGLNTVMKLFFERPRPEVVPHLSEVMSLSFPSGHAMQSAVIYLTLGALLMRIADRRATKVFCMVFAMLIVALVGMSRVYLGVHYPTDVLAGWLMGFAWALTCWLVERSLERRSGLARVPHRGLDPQ